MVRFLFSLLVVLFFTGCAVDKVKIEPIKKLPHYDKNKANVYFINN